MTEQEHYDNVLLTLRRKYSQDEEVGILIQKIKSLEYENGMLKSEVSERNYKHEKTVQNQADKIAHFERSKKELTSKIRFLEDEIEMYRAQRRESFRKESELLKQLLAK